MKFLKQFLSFALLLSLIGSFAACGQAPAKEAASTTAPVTTEATEPAPRELTEEEKAILQERRDIAEAYMRESLSVL